MRITSTALARTARRALATATVGAAMAGMAVLAGGTAAASTTITTSNCAAPVSARIGEQVAVSGEAVKEHVRAGAQAAKSIILIHDLSIWPNHLARKIGDEQLVAGQVPNAKTATIDGAAIGAVVRKELEGSAGLGALPETQRQTLDRIAQEVAKHCGLQVTATNWSAPNRAPAQDQSPRTSAAPNGAPSGAAGNAAAEGTTPVTGGAPVPRRDYGGIPVAQAPGADIGLPPDLKYPPSGSLPGTPSAPDIGVLGGQSDAGADSGQGARSAGEVQSLAADEPTDAVQLPMLLAVVALAGVTAGLVRTWVLRKAS